MPRYIPLLRPPGFATLPPRLEWTYVEVPAYITLRRDLPRSIHPHGVIECRKLTADECERFDLREVIEDTTPSSTYVASPYSRDRD